MLDRIFTLALAAGILALAASTVIGFGHGPGIGPRLVEFDRVMINGKRLLDTDKLATAADNRR